MGAYTNIKGWIELPEDLARHVQTILSKYLTQEYLIRFSVKEHQVELYSNGWVMQKSSINGFQHVFYGAKIRAHLTDYIKAQVEEIAQLNVEGEDYILQPKGFFYLEEDGTYDIPEQQWKVSKGIVNTKANKL